MVNTLASAAPRELQGWRGTREFADWVLVHMGPGLSGSEARGKAEADVQAVFPGEVVFSDELMSIPL